MIRVFDYRRDVKKIDRIADRSFEIRQEVERRVRAIVLDVKQRGDRALREYTAEFDGATVGDFAVKATEAERAFRRAPDSFKRALSAAARNIRRFHARQGRRSWFMRDGSGSRLGLQIRPIEGVGIYIPGGKAAYPSSVLMSVIPAQIAGVREIVLVSPPRSDGQVNEAVLVATGLLGVDRVYRVGGAQAIAALAYGTQSIPQVDKIVGPGNIYVQAAKRMVFGDVGIDSFAGPSEVLVVADRGANARYIAADLLAQAEHDRDATCLLISTSRDLLEDVKREISIQVKNLARRNTIEHALEHHGALIFVPRILDAIDLVNEIAPEHLELLTRDNKRLLSKIHHAGAIFLGEHSPVAVGDYCAGPNHILPTARSARFSSALTVEDFLKTSNVIEYSRRRLAQVESVVSELATREGLEAHRASIAVRFSHSSH